MRWAFALFLLTACGTDVDLGGTGALSVDGGVTCGSLVSPAIDAGCRACTSSSGDCQSNGCYGGYWCNVDSLDCHAPPTTCP